MSDSAHHIPPSFLPFAAAAAVKDRFAKLWPALHFKLQNCILFSPDAQDGMNCNEKLSYFLEHKWELACKQLILILMMMALNTDKFLPRKKQISFLQIIPKKLFL